MLYHSGYYDPQHLAYKVQRYKDIDIIHVHNEPDWFGHVCKSVRPDVPVVFDAHDLFSVRLPHAADKFQDEVQSFKKCDAFVYPSKGYQKHCAKLYKQFGVDKKPNEVIYSMCNEDFLKDSSMPRIGGIVYEGGLRVKEPHPEIPEDMKYHQYRDFNGVFEYLTKQGIPVVAFAANQDAMMHHGNSGALITPPMPYPALINHLSRFDWGIVGSPIPGSLQWKYAMPHKLFEYIAAGIPILAFGADELCQFVEKHQIGVALDTIEDIPKVYGDHDKYRKNLWFLQTQFTMEKQIPKLVKLYEELI
jgi:glycosyltransferase involved in cell wall biosynthesis